MSTKKRYLTIKELSELLNVKSSTLYAWASQGKIPCLRFYGLLRFDLADIENWIESSKNSVERAPKISKPKPIASSRMENIIREAIDSSKSRGYHSPDRGSQAKSARKGGGYGAV
ncbi:MAG: helix-turn-helix domain-containing protein [Candidatus Nitrospinota bacterium M3_3B_026]